MVAPIDYSIDVQSPFQAALAGYQAGAAIRNDQQQQAQLEQQRAAQLQMQRDLGALSANRNATGADFAAVMTKYPQFSEQLSKSWSTLNDAQRQSKVSQGTQAYAALQAGRTDVAEQLFRDQAAAARNSGAEDIARQSETMAELIKLHPESARTSIALSLSAAMGPEKFAETFAKLGQEQRAADQAPAELRSAEAGATKAEADAVTAGVDAKFAEQKAVLDLQKRGWDIKALQEDIGFKREANRIAAMNAATAREGNSLKREELQLKVADAREKLDGKIREKVATAEAGAANIDNMLNTIERIKKNPRLDDVLGGIEGRSPVIRDDSVDAVALIETLGSQAFLAQIPNIKGMGALSNAEGEKLQSALQNLSRTQSEKQFRANLDEAARLLNKGRETLSRSTGVPLGKPDTPAAPGARPPLSSFEGR